MVRPRNMAKAAVEQSALLKALQFISVAQRSDDNAVSPAQTHCIIENRWAVAFDGERLAAGHPIDEDIAICPHTETFVDALRRCGQTFTLIQLDAAKLNVKNERFRAVVPCIGRDILPGCAPDPAIEAATVNDSLKQALEAVGQLASETADKIAFASVLVRAGSAVATNGFVMLECWHGLNLPVMALPKASAAALCKIALPLVGFGYSGRTATFHFEGGAWLRTQLWEAEYPNVDRILDRKSNAWAIPEGFFAAVRAVEPFNKGQIFFGNNELRSHEADGIGAAQLVSGIPQGIRYNAKHLLVMEQMKTADFVGQGNCGYFFGNNVRGVVTQVAKSTEEIIAERRAYLSSPEYAAEQERLAQEREVKRAKWQAEHDAKPWTPTKHLETFEAWEEEQDIPF